MMCERPMRTGAVYPQFDEAIHVAAFPDTVCEGSRMLGGIDFGFRDPTVVVWASVGTDGTVRIVGELVTRETTMESLGTRIRAAPWPVPEWFGVDPAGLQRSSVSGLSPILALRRAGFSIRSRRLSVMDGLRAVRARLAPAVGAPTLLVHPRCTGVIASLRDYRFPEGPGDGVAPVKDGPDHGADALRYLITNLDASVAYTVRSFSYL
jgi:hypothetical protein